MITFVLNNQRLYKGNAPAIPYDLVQLQNNNCFYCGLKMVSRTRDHLFPASLGFSFRGNIVYSCSNCNQEKGSRLPTLDEIKRAAILYKSHDFFIARIQNGKIKVRLTDNDKVGFVIDDVVNFNREIKISIENVDHAKIIIREKITNIIIPNNISNSSQMVLTKFLLRIANNVEYRNNTLRGKTIYDSRLKIITARLKADRYNKRNKKGFTKIFYNTRNLMIPTNDSA